MVFIEDLADYLISQGIGTSTDTDVICYGMPSDPDVCIALIIGGGSAPDKMTSMEYPGCRVLCRNVIGAAGVLAAYDQAYAIKKFLHRAVGLTLGGVLYHRIDATTPVVPNNSDAKGRPMFEISFIATKEEE